MPVALTYPGVYVEEIPSGVRTITGVATSIAAFLGRALRGPVNRPVVLNSYADFERIFGGLWIESSLGFAVQDFFRNGGGQALVVRLYRPEEPTDPTTAELSVNGLVLRAASEGAWGNRLRVRIDHDPVDIAAQVAARLGVTPNDLFNLTVRDNATGTVERFTNLTLVSSPRQIGSVLADGMGLLRFHNTALTARPVAHPVVPAGQDVWSEAPGNTFSTGVSASVGEPGPLDDTAILGSEAQKTGLWALEHADLFNVLYIPPYDASTSGEPLNGDVSAAVIAAAAVYCEKRRAILVIDAPSDWNKDDARDQARSYAGTSRNAALYFPRVRKPNPLRQGRLEIFGGGGAVAGVYARIDATRGVWKAPAGLEAALIGVVEPSLTLTDAENGELNPVGVNCLRVRPAAGPVVWGARTRQGDDRLASEWKYLPVRRLALYLEESLYRGTQWAVFEPNDERLWGQLRLNVGAFLQNLFRQGAFQGQTPREAYFVKVDRETTTQNDVDRGIVNVMVGFAPLKPAEFVILQFQQIAGQIEV